LKKILRKFTHFDVDHFKTPYDSTIHTKKNKGIPVAQYELTKITYSVVFTIELY